MTRQRPLVFLCIGLGMLVAAHGQSPGGPPTFTADSIVPSGKDTRTSLAPGMLVSIYGTGLGPVEGCEGRADPTRRHEPSPQRPHQVLWEVLAYPSELCGVGVEVGGEPAGLLYAQERQINFQVPQSAPAEGTAEIRVIHGGQPSQPVEVKFGLEIISVKLAEPAYAGMPVWIDVSMPFGWENSIQYPFGLDPADMGCHQVEVRRQGELLPRRAGAGERRLWSGVRTGPMCGSLGLPDESKHIGWIPLHTLYRFDQAGTYEVQFTARQAVIDPGVQLHHQPYARSEWTPFEVAEAQADQRKAWLTSMERDTPFEVVDLLTYVLPSLLAEPDADSLAVFQEYLYHPETLVRRFAAQGLAYWPQEQVSQRLKELLFSKGPSDVTAGLLAGRQGVSTADADRYVDTSTPHLRSPSQVLVRGAMTALTELALRENSPASPAARERAAGAMIEAADHVAAVADPQTVTDFAAALGQVRSAEAKDLLWQWADKGIAAEQALYAITWSKDPGDLTRLGRLLRSTGESDDRFFSLPNALHYAYGDAAIPHLEQVLRESKNAPVRTAAAEELMLSGQPPGFAYAAETIETDGRGKTEILRFVRQQFPESREQEEPEIVAALKQRAQAP